MNRSVSGGSVCLLECCVMCAKSAAARAVYKVCDVESAVSLEPGPGWPRWGWVRDDDRVPVSGAQRGRWRVGVTLVLRWRSIKRV